MSALINSLSLKMASRAAGRDAIFKETDASLRFRRWRLRNIVGGLTTGRRRRQRHGVSDETWTKAQAACSSQDDAFVGRPFRAGRPRTFRRWPALPRGAAHRAARSAPHSRTRGSEASAALRLRFLVTIVETLMTLRARRIRRSIKKLCAAGRDRRRMASSIDGLLPVHAAISIDILKFRPTSSSCPTAGLAWAAHSRTVPASSG